ncbi:MAG TPA: hypothetical protein VNN62_23290 [Methylomirabilota bacterium]|jgi:hypothetical protein|nr:hypothetical protein [Methylomirabilota bacterium]
MTHREIYLIRVLLGFALVLAGLFPLCLIVLGVTTTLWIWGLVYAVCVARALMLWYREYASPQTSPEGHSPELTGGVVALIDRVSTAHPRVAREEVVDIVWSVLNELFPDLDETQPGVPRRSVDAERLLHSLPTSQTREATRKCHQSKKNMRS